MVSEISTIGVDNYGGVAALMLPGLADCKALSRMHLCLGSGYKEAARAALQLTLSHEALDNATIHLSGCQPFSDPSNQDDQALLLELHTTAKDLCIELGVYDNSEDSIRGLVRLCGLPSVRKLSLVEGPPQGPRCLWNAWGHFTLLRCLDLARVLLDDSCVAALNRLALLEELSLRFIRQQLQKMLTQTIQLPCLQRFDAFLENSPAHQADLHESVIGAAESWNGSCSVTDALLHCNNLLSMLRAPQLQRCALQYAVVTAQTFLQLQRRSPHLQLESCNLAVLVEDSQLEAVAKNCPQLLAAGRCRFRGITHYGLMSTAVNVGRSLTELCGASSDASSPAFLPTLPIPVQADDSSILAVAQHCPNLTKLQLHSTSRAFTKPSILHIAAHLPLLKVLELLGCTGLDDSCLCALVRGCPEQDHLSLDGLWRVSAVAISVSLVLLHRLVSVSLAEADRFTISGLRALLAGSKSLQQVHIHAAPHHCVWNDEFRKMRQEQLDSWGAGTVSSAWHGAAGSSILHIQRVHAGLQL
jgi:hypothetical protein